MARPTIDHLLDSIIQIWRPVIADDSIGIEERSYVPVAAVAARCNRPSQVMSDTGPGMAPVGTLRWYGRPDIDVQAKDVCEIVSSPELPPGRTFEVNAPPVTPKNHHTQVDCIEWNGELPDDS